MPLSITPEERQKYIEQIQDFRLIDDTFFHACFHNDKRCMELVIRIILDKPKLKILRMHTQEEVPNLYGRSVRFDVFAQDADGTEYNIEVQRNDDGADPHRARYNASLLDTMNVPSGADWKQLPRTIVIFITENDVIGGGLPLYHIHRTIDELDGKQFGDDAEIIYVNGKIKNETMLGWLMHDFFCRNPVEMHYKLLAERANFFKSNEHGVNNMCRIMEKIEKEGFAKGVAETTLKIIRNQLKRHIPYEEISEVTETPIDEVIRIAKESNLAY